MMAINYLQHNWNENIPTNQIVSFSDLDTFDHDTPRLIGYSYDIHTYLYNDQIITVLTVLVHIGYPFIWYLNLQVWFNLVIAMSPWGWKIDANLPPYSANLPPLYLGCWENPLKMMVFVSHLCWGWPSNIHNSSQTFLLEVQYTIDYRCIVGNTRY